MKLKKIKETFKRMHFKRMRAYLTTSLGFFIVILGVFSFALAFHNMDLAQNFEEINLKNNFIFLKYGLENEIHHSETTLSGQIVDDFQEVYRKAVNILYISLFLVIMGVFIFTTGLMQYEYLIGNLKRYSKK